MWALWITAALASPSWPEVRDAVLSAEQAAPLDAPRALLRAQGLLDDYAAAHPRAARTRSAARRLAAAEDAMPDARRARAEALLLAGLEAPEPVLELAALYLADARAIEQLNRDARALCGEAPGCPPPPDAAAADPASGPRRRAVALYERFLAEYPDHARAEEARYLLADALVAEGRTDEARTHLNRLVGGPYTGHALLQRGNLFFTAGDYRRALADYQGAAERLPDELGRYARYRAALCLQRLDRAAEAADQLRALLEDDGPDGLLPAAVRQALEQVTPR